MTYTKATHLTEWIETARRAMEVEGNAILSAASRLDDNLARAATLILNRPGRLIITGIGKSGHVARKLVSTMCSTGTPAAFLHAAEAAHGDLGLYGQGDPTLMISRSGATCELLRLTSFLREIESPCIGIIGAAAVLEAAVPARCRSCARCGRALAANRRESSERPTPSTPGPPASASSYPPVRPLSA